MAGGLLMAAWGGPRNRGQGMMLGVAGMCLSALVAMSLAGDVPGWCAAVLVGALLMTVVNASMQAIVQSKVPQQWQGRVFGAVMFLSQISVPLATAAAGPLADQLFEPEARHGSGLFVLLGPLLGHRPGSGMAGMLFLAGVIGTVVALWGLAAPSIRHIDTLIPDVGADELADQAAGEGADEAADEGAEQAADGGEAAGSAGTADADDSSEATEATATAQPIDTPEGQEGYEGVVGMRCVRTGGAVGEARPRRSPWSTAPSG
ncbi:MFS transporter [Streptacidiphilus sp. 4-A2]|nr:MFS transporter [Streptacidiphilus sp. 4-A2]